MLFITYFLNKIGISCLKIEIEKCSNSKESRFAVDCFYRYFFVKHVKINFHIMQCCLLCKNVQTQLATLSFIAYLVLADLKTLHQMTFDLNTKNSLALISPFLYSSGQYGYFLVIFKASVPLKFSYVNYKRRKQY